jgi:hypothetical protein
MNVSPQNTEMDPIDRAIALAEAALRECDEHGYVYAAIDLSSALDKLAMIRAATGPQ